MIYLSLFISFIQVGMFSFGGGYAAMPLIQQQVVNIHHWLTMKQFTDLVTISAMTPGPIAINSATFVGIRIAGFWGAIVATFGCILPSCILVSVLAYIYRKYKNASEFGNVMSCLRPVVVALIASAGISILQTALFGEKTVNINSMDIINGIIFIAAFVILRKFKWNPILVMSLCGAVGLCANLLAGVL